MAQQPEQNQNAYPIDVESVAEMTRLLDQDTVLTEAMGGIFPELDKTDLDSIHQILDIGCGPGGWVQEVAYTYPAKEVTGIDISRAMIQYAQAFAQVRHLSNARFYVMNALKPLDFPDNAFDLINMRTVIGFLAPADWPPLLAECKRVLRPGGIVRITEGEYGMANTPAYETMWGLINKAGFLAKRSFSPTGINGNSTVMLRRLLQQANFAHVQSQAHVLDYSFGTKAHAGAYHDYRLMFKLLKPFLLKTGVTTAEAFAQLYEQAMLEVQSEDFCALAYLLTVWGTKPQ